MQKAAAFFGGAVLGGVLSAACGLDLFREDREREPRETIAGLREELRGTKALLEQSKSLLRESDARARTLSEKTSSREMDAPVQAKKAELARNNAELARSSTELAAFRGELVRLQSELDLFRKSRDAAEIAARKWEALLKEQVISFFSRERDEWDAGLASQFLAAAASKEAQHELILALIKKNKSILMSLPHDEGAEGGFGAAHAELAPASARELESTPPGKETPGGQ